MLKYILLLLFVLNINSAFAATYTNGNFSPYYNNYQTAGSRLNTYTQNRYRTPIRNRHYSHHHPYSSYNRLPANSLSALERYALKKNYAREDEISRLERLESLAFGSVQRGDIESRYKNVENAILSRPQTNYKKSLLSNLGNFFAGQATGYTPGINSFNAQPYPYNTPSYSTSRVEQYSNGMFGGGWGMMNQNFGNGSSIRILD